jgi:hypothetical protein
MTDQRLVVALRVLVKSAYVVEDISFIGDIADVVVDSEGTPIGSEPFFVTSLVMIDGTYVVIQDRLVLRAAYLTEYFQ